MTAQINKGLHILSQIFAFVTDDIELSCQWLRKGDHLYVMLVYVFLDQQTGKNCYSKSFGDAADDSLCTGAFPERMYSDLP